MNNSRANEKIVNDLIRRVENYKYVDVGVGAEAAYFATREQFNKAVNAVVKSGYHIRVLKPVGSFNLGGRHYLKILSKSPLTSEEIEQHMLAWETARLDIFSMKRQAEVLGNMERYNLAGFKTSEYRMYRVADAKNYRTTCRAIRRKELDLCSLLITNMVVNGAQESEIADIIKYSLVVLDSAWDFLDLKKAAEELKVQEMIDKYM